MLQKFRRQAMESSYEILINKLNNFRRKYYINLIIRGLLILIGITTGIILLFSAYEFFSWSGTQTRTILFYLALAMIVATLVTMVIIPALKIFRLGKTLTNDEAAGIIGDHFPEVSDKLLNTLQLKNTNNAENYELLLASIEQKAAELKPISFRNAISFRSNIKFLNYVLPLIILIVVLLIIKPQFITSPTTRIINHTKVFNKPLPYSITLLNSEFTCKQNDDYQIMIQVTGEVFPEKIWVDDGDYTYRMNETKPGYYIYTYKNIMGNKSFKIITDDYTSSIFNIEVYPVPIIVDFSIKLDYPNYLSKTDEIINNTGDLTIPQNTLLNWTVLTRDTKFTKFIIDDSIHILEKNKSNEFNFTKRINSNVEYSIIAINDYFESNDTLKFNIETVADEFPVIKVREFKGDFNAQRIDYSGEIFDDYGFSVLNFYFKKDETEDKWNKMILKSDFTNSVYKFDFQVVADSFGLNPGESAQYYFEVQDNDYFNGYKKSKSENFYIRMPEIEKIEKQIEDNTDQVKEKLNESIKQLNNLNEQIENKKFELYNKKELDWLDKEQLNNLFEKSEDIKKNIEELKKLNKEIQQLEDLINKKINPELRKKLDELQKMLDELYNEEMKKMLEELRENLNKENLNEMLEKIKDQNKDLKSDLEQNLELFKQWEYENMISEAIEKLEKLSEEQLELSGKTENKEENKEISIDQQKDIQNDFSDIMENLKKAEELNKELEDPFNLKTDTTTANDIYQQMDNAQENLEKGKNKKAAESQQQSGQNMKKMANSLSLEMEAAMEERMGEDIEQVKNILDNLIDISFAQEDLILELSKIDINDPKDAEIRELQKALRDDFSIVQDSLIAISKRQENVKPFIIKQTKSITSHIDNSLDYLQQQNLGKSTREQQYALTSINNLALMLSEALNQMQQSMQMSSSNNKGNSKCKNPGSGKSSMSEIKKQQKGLNEGMKGKMNKNGLDGENGLNSNSKELAKMAAQQGEIRRMLQELMKQIESEGGNGDALSKIAQEMQKTEEDLINRRLTQESYERQKNIETRLLKSDKAIQEREKENKRESKEGKNRNKGNQLENIEYKYDKNNREEILITEPIELKPYYRRLYKKYLYLLENENKDGN